MRGLYERVIEERGGEREERRGQQHISCRFFELLTSLHSLASQLLASRQM